MPPWGQLSSRARPATHWPHCGPREPTAAQSARAFARGGSCSRSGAASGARSGPAPRRRVPAACTSAAAWRSPPPSADRGSRS
eukprot:11039711-Alexandrium_andersonii.AAC.1